MKTAFTLHQIERKEGPLEPGSVAEFEDKQFDELLALGAIREPSDDERALAELGKPKAAAAATDDLNPLHTEAEALGIKFSAKISDEKLQERIDEAKAAKAKADEEAAAAQKDQDEVTL